MNCQVELGARVRGEDYQIESRAHGGPFKPSLRVLSREVTGPNCILKMGQLPPQMPDPGPCADVVSEQVRVPRGRAPSPLQASALCGLFAHSPGVWV